MGLDDSIDLTTLEVVGTLTVPATPEIPPTPDPDKQPVSDWQIRKRDPDYFRKRMFAYDLWSGFKNKALATKHGIGRKTVTSWKQDATVKVFVAEYDRDLKAHSKGIQAVIRSGEPEMLETLHGIVMNPVTPPSVRVNVAQDWLDRGASAPKVREIGQAAPQLNITIEQMNLIGETTAQTLQGAVADVLDAEFEKE